MVSAVWQCHHEGWVQWAEGDFPSGTDPSREEEKDVKTLQKNILYRNNSVDTSVFSVFSSSPSFFTIKDICMKMGTIFLNPSPGIWVSSAALPMRSFPPCMTSWPRGQCWKTVAAGLPLGLSSLSPSGGLLGTEYVPAAVRG